MKNVQIENYEEFYTISKDGEIFSIRSNKLLKSRVDSKSDRSYVNLRKNKIRRKYYIDDLIAGHFKKQPRTDKTDGNVFGLKTVLQRKLSGWNSN
jgi:hypothetical protein